jgi:Arc/MetJ-type ribon-helix-helix transcriptional regulator
MKHPMLRADEIGSWRKDMKRITVRLSDEEAEMVEDLRSLLLVGSESAAIRRAVSEVYSAYRSAGALRSLESLRRADSRQLSLLKDELKKKNPKSKPTTGHAQRKLKKGEQQ